MSMPNPSPRQTEEFKKHCYQPKGAVYSDYPLADKPTQVRLAEDITAAVDALGEDKTPWLRRVISEAAKRELLGQPEMTGKENHEPSPPPASPQVDVQELVKELAYILTIHGLPSKARQAIKELMGRLSSK